MPVHQDFISSKLTEHLPNVGIPHQEDITTWPPGDLSGCRPMDQTIKRSCEAPVAPVHSTLGYQGA